jgi:LuxR family transcriptional regulator, maltose regulon positive regulatory protein
VELGQPSGLVRPFVELGAPLAGLLAELIARLPLEERGYPARLLAAFPPASGPSEMVLPSRHHAEDQLAEPLTWRETEVLELLEERLTNKEIAQALTISPETVKKHVANICQKLQVENRRQAVARGRVLGLLTRPGARAP